MGCNCNNQQTNYNICNPKPCQEPQDCSCPTILKSDCVVFSGNDLECSGIVTGQTLTETVEQLDTFICEKVNDITNALNLKNIGTGAKVYKGDDLLGRKELRTVTKTGNLVTVTENTDDVTLTIDETKLSQFVKDNQNNFTFTGENVGTGVGVYKETTGLVHKFKTLKAENVGTGTFSLLKPITATTNEVTISAKTIKTNNLDITEEPDGTLTIDTPVSTSNLSFYVDEASVANTETGTLSSPFKTLNKALDAFIGTGTWFNPQYNGYKITLLSQCTLQETAGVGYNGYTNLDVNNLQIEGNGFYLTLPSNPSTDYYPISTRRMVTNMPKTAGVLNYDIQIIIKNTILQRVGTNAIIDHLNYSFPQATIVGAYPPQQTTSGITIEGCTLTNDTILSGVNWSTISNPNDAGNPLLLFGTPIYASNTSPIGVPMVKSEGRIWTKEGNFNFDNNNLINSTGTFLKFKDTVLNSVKGATKIGRNSYRRMYETEFEDYYSPKVGLYAIEVEDVNYIRIENFEYNGITPRMNSTQTPPKNLTIGGDECVFNIKNSNVYLKNVTGQEQCYSYIFFDGTSAIQLSNFYDTADCQGKEGFFKVTAPLPLVGKKVYVENSMINQVVTDFTEVDKSLIKQVDGYSNVINNAPHSDYFSYLNDSDAILGGLIKGNVYYNTTIGGLKTVM